jgi:hypothetical protein
MQPTLAAPSVPSSGKTSFQQTCGSCGCIFQVDITWRRSFSYRTREERDYCCPECQRGSRINAASTPEVILLARRTDGRS